MCGAVFSGRWLQRSILPWRAGDDCECRERSAVSGAGGLSSCCPGSKEAGPPPVTRPCRSCNRSSARMRRRGRNRLAVSSWTERNLCACLADLNRPWIFLRFRVGRCDPSIRLFSSLCARWSTFSPSFRRAAAWLRSLSVTMTRGSPQWVISREIKRFAARALRRDCTKMSRTSPLLSTARHSQCRTPLIMITTSSTCHLSAGHERAARTRFAICGANFPTHARIVS